MNLGIFSIVICAAFASPILAEDGQESPVRQTGMKIRPLAVALNGDLATVRLRSNEKDLGEITLETTSLGLRYGVPVRTFTFGKDQKDGSFLPLGTIVLPETGHDFILVFVPFQKSYRVFPVRADDPEFRSNDSFLFNFTPYPVGVNLGGSKKLITPMRHARISPSIPKDATYYQASFAYEKGGKMIAFNNTRWPVNPNLKALVFVYMDQQTQEPAYRGVSTLAME